MTTKKLSAQERLLRLLPDTLRATLTIRLFGLTKIPLLLYVRPSVVEISDEKVVVKIPLRRRTKNHLRAMYFGALAMGADCAGGLIAMQQIMESRENISLLFKNLSAEFLKRAEGDVYFTCTEGLAISDLVREAIHSEDRLEMPVHITATVPDKLGDEPVAVFTLLLSIKKK